MNEDLLLNPDFSEDENTTVEVEQMPGEYPEQPQSETEEIQMVEQAPSAPVRKNGWQKRLFKDARDVLYMLAVFMLVYILCFRTVVVVGSSMYDTLVDGDRLLLVNNLLYFEPKQGDIVVANKKDFRDGECIIKRVIATEGQHVRINFETGTVYVDDVAIEEPYLYSLTLNQESDQTEWTVPDGCLFVMGDNRMGSTDSRSNSIGFIDRREILGRAIILMIPGYDEERAIRDFGRIGVIE